MGIQFLMAGDFEVQASFVKSYRDTTLIYYDTLSGLEEIPAPIAMRFW